MIAEIDIQFSTLVQVPLVPVSEYDYRIAAGGVWRLILMEEHTLRWIYDPEKLAAKTNRIEKLNKILEDFRKIRRSIEDTEREPSKGKFKSNS